MSGYAIFVYDSRVNAAVVSVISAAVAEAVLHRCMETNAESEEDPKKVEVEFNYEFLDDYYVEPSKEELLRLGSSGVNKETNEKEWQPNFSTKDHPLALMVSYFEGNRTYT